MFNVCPTAAGGRRERGVTFLKFGKGYKANLAHFAPMLRQRGTMPLLLRFGRMPALQASRSVHRGRCGGSTRAFGAPILGSRLGWLSVTMTRCSTRSVLSTLARPEPFHDTRIAP